MLPPFNSNSKQEKEERRVFCFEYEEDDERFRVANSRLIMSTQQLELL